MLNPSRCARTLAVVSTGLLLGAPARLTTGAVQQTITGGLALGDFVLVDNRMDGGVRRQGQFAHRCRHELPRAGAVEIFDGRVDAGTMHFKCRSEDGKSTIAFSGKVNGDRITFSWDLHEPEPVPPPAYDTGERPGEIIVRRVSDGAGRLILDRLAERRRTTRPPFTALTFDRILNSEREQAAKSQGTDLWNFEKRATDAGHP